MIYAELMPLSPEIQRLVRDAAAGRMSPVPPMPAIPADKASFPKVLAIDCNHWIALASVHHGKSTAVDARAALDAIRIAVAHGRLVVALHFINAFEAAKRRDEGSKERLVGFMVSEARSMVFRPFRQIRAAEIRAAIDSTYGLRPSPLVRPLAFGRGMDALMGSPRSDEFDVVSAKLDALGLREALAELFATPEWTTAAILDAIQDRGIIHQERERAQVMDRVRLTDGTLSAKERKRLELQNQWDGGFGQDVQTVLSELGIPRDTFSEWLSADDHLFAFWGAIPSVQVLLDLEIASAKQRDRAFEANDFRDMSFYETAIPYANVLLTETYWADRIRYAKLHERYDTRVLHRLADVPSMLAEAKCI